jgi:hypothetical protein
MRDDGIGIPEDFNVRVGKHNDRRFGNEVLHSLDDLNGRYNIAVNDSEADAFEMSQRTFCLGRAMRNENVETSCVRGDELTNRVGDPRVGKD